MFYVTRLVVYNINNRFINILAISITNIAFVIYIDFVPKKHKAIIVTKKGFIIINNIKSFFGNNFIKPKFYLLKLILYSI
jgi:hypothetical protein